MEHIGYSLVAADNSETRYWGDTKGQLWSLPSLIILPNGDQVHGAMVGDVLSDFRLVERWLNDEPPSPWHASIGRAAALDGDKIVVTVIYEDVPSIVPQTVTPRQARLALLAAGLLDQAESAVEAAGGATKITWEYATEINRNDPMIISIGSVLDLTSDQIDELFRSASNL